MFIFDKNFKNVIMNKNKDGCLWNRRMIFTKMI